MNYIDKTGQQENYDEANRRDIDLLVCHFTAGTDDDPFAKLADAQAGERATINWLTRSAEHGGGGVSAHYLIGAETTGAPIYQLGKEKDILWHAGGNPNLGYPSRWTDPDSNRQYVAYDVNAISIGIEVYKRKGDALGERQKAAIRVLVADIISRHPKITWAGHIVAHADIQGNRDDGRDWKPIALDVAAQAGKTKETGVSNPQPQPLRPLTPPDSVRLNNHLIAHGFFSLWQSGGGVAIFGLPITDEMDEVGDDGVKRVVQYFERARLEYNLTTQQITRGLVGREAFLAKYPKK